MGAWLPVLPRDRALVAPVRPETVLRECRGSPEAGSATAPALPCEVGDWNHSRLGDTHTQEVVLMVLHYLGGCPRLTEQTWRNSVTGLGLSVFTESSDGDRHCVFVA